jgi:cytochrome d ubiquinol oxidase subunit II
MTAMLESIWFFLWGLLWAVYFMLDGFDLGVGTLMPFLAQNERDKRVMYNAVGPFWDGNEVWLIAAGGVTFAAFPRAYAVMFSGLYTALMLLLFALIIRGVSFEFRSRVDNPAWKKTWDICQFVGSFLPALLLGVAFANIFQGLPLDARGINQGGLLDLLNPYGLAGGVLFVLMFVTHGALWISIRATGDLQARAAAAAAKTWPVLVVVTAAFLIWSAVGTHLLNNYLRRPLLFVELVLPVAGLILMRTFLGAGKYLRAWMASSAYIVGVAFFGIVGLYPAILPSSLNPGWSVTIHNSASSTLTLQIMLGVALIFVPIVILYQIWVYRHFSHPVTDADLKY